MLEGFYPLESIFLLLALIALARIPSLEALRYVAPGEWGKLMGLDRIPEVRTLRQKITELCSEQGLAERWSNALAKQWMAQEPECAGVFYADGHVRVYHGKLTDLPRRYIARERLCLRGTTDYWVNAMDGRPFFVVSCAVDPGLLNVLREHIAPRLKADVPNQPTEEQLEEDSLLSRFTIVFDREGYSPQFFAQELPDQDGFRRLRSEKKHFIDTIKLIAYRAETALAQLAREKIKRLDEARSLIRQLFRTEIDLIPDPQNKTLTVRLHPMTTQAHDEIVRHICAELTATETVFPGTDLRLIYEISGSC